MLGKQPAEGFIRFMQEALKQHMIGYIGRIPSLISKELLFNKNTIDKEGIMWSSC